LGRVPNRRRENGLRALLAGLACAVALALLFWPGSASSGPTDPTLSLSAALAETGASQRLVRVEGIFPAADLVQIPYPLQLLIREVQTGTGYVRFDLSGGVFEGNAPELADGLDASDAAGLLSQGTPAPGGAVLFLGRDRIEILLPPGFPSGAAEAQLFVVTAESPVPVLSNPVAFQVPGTTP